MTTEEQRSRELNDPSELSSATVPRAGSSALSASRTTEVSLILSLTNEYTSKLRELCLRERARETIALYLALAFLGVVATTVTILPRQHLQSVVPIVVACLALIPSIFLLLRSRSRYHFQVDVAARVLEKIVRRASELHENQALSSTERLELDIRLGEAEGTLALARRRRSFAESATREAYYEEYLRHRKQQ